MHKLTKTTLTILATAVLLGGCSPADFLNEQFLASIVGSSATTLPGNAPALLVAVENQTGRPAAVQVAYRDANNALRQYTAALEPGQRTAKALMCPVSEITVGDLSDPLVTGAWIEMANGGAFIEVEPFGRVLKTPQNYDCGDGITFVLQPSGATRSGYQLFAYVQRASEGG
ncbi:MAG: hypothetical protein GX547_15175 [Phycisphaerae bacterium]|jgi:hypothetical protein|nr:hypothetical protein [Phycisphaerae bacterium]